jgi:hypothetical protein
MPNIDWSNIEKETVTLAKTILHGYAGEALKDAQAFRVRVEQQMHEWSQDLRNGEITQKNFASLVRGERDLAEMQALKQVGLAQVALDTFTSGFMEIVLNAALAAI